MKNSKDMTLIQTDLHNSARIFQKYSSLIDYDDKTSTSTIDQNMQFYYYAYGKQ
jgi:hypothetical protein